MNTAAPWCRSWISVSSSPRASLACANSVATNSPMGQLKLMVQPTFRCAEAAPAPATRAGQLLGPFASPAPLGTAPSPTWRQETERACRAKCRHRQAARRLPSRSIFMRRSTTSSTLRGGASIVGTSAAFIGRTTWKLQTSGSPASDAWV